MRLYINTDRKYETDWYGYGNRIGEGKQPNNIIKKNNEK